MPDFHHLLLFVAAGWLLNLTPGPDVLYIVTLALRGGVRAGVMAALGITAGCFVHIVAAAVGVSALMAASGNHRSRATKSFARQLSTMAPASGEGGMSATVSSAASRT